MRNYTRWRRVQEDGGRLVADILGAAYELSVDRSARTATIEVGGQVLTMTPDEARMVGVRFIEAAAIADGDRAVRDVR